MDLQGKICLITGGSSGIGAATVLALAEKGAHVAAFARRPPDDADEIGIRARGLGNTVYYGSGDVAKPEDCRRMIEETVSQFGGLDVLVHCAGGAAPGSLLNITPEQWHRAFDVHLHSIFHLSRAAVPAMKARNGGAIVLISSAAGLRGVNGAIAYSVVKGAIPQFVRSMARELADDKIRVNAVTPGVIRTPFQDYLSPEQVKNNVDNRIPLHREGTAGDVAEVIVMLITNEFITGESLTVDGGMSMRMV
jgi:NAD(P)-dependent dehydrogenase (short-subunit alcohol dehydrogenase family)